MEGSSDAAAFCSTLLTAKVVLPSALFSVMFPSRSAPVLASTWNETSPLPVPESIPPSAPIQSGYSTFQPTLSLSVTWIDGALLPSALMIQVEGKFQDGSAFGVSALAACLATHIVKLLAPLLSMSSKLREEPVSFAGYLTDSFPWPVPVAEPDSNVRRLSNTTLQPALAGSLMFMSKVPPAGFKVRYSPRYEEGRSQVAAAFAADCSIVNDFEYVPLPSVLSPVRVTVAIFAELPVFSA